jgi:hypothetical protein
MPRRVTAPGHDLGHTDDGHTDAAGARGSALPFALLAAALATVGLPQPAAAQPGRAVAPGQTVTAAGPTPQASEEEEEDDPDEGTRRAPAADLRANHVVLEARGSLLGPAGQLVRGFGIGRAVAPGGAIGGALGYGLGRYGTVEVFGDYARLGAGSGCPGCSASTYALGLSLTYHLAQGIAFDPSLTFGVAYRALSIDAGDEPLAPQLGGGADATFRGIDVARIRLAGTFFPVQSLGFGPFLGLDLGTFFRRPQPVDVPGGPSVHVLFHVGARVVFDPVQALGLGRPASAPAPASARSPAPPAPNVVPSAAGPL